MKQTVQQNGPGSAVYGLGVIGAIIYFVSTADGFWDAALGILKAMVWPAFIVYEFLAHFAV